MKKTAVLLCAAALVFSLSGCGRQEQDGGGTQTSQETASAQETGGAQNGSQNNAQDSEDAQGGSQDAAQGGSGAGQNGTQGAEQSGAAGEGGSQENGWSSDMEKIKAAVTETLGDNYWPNSRISPEMLEGTFGVSADLYDDYMGEMPMISTNVDTLLVIKAKEDKVQEVEDALTAYRDALVGDTMQYPMNLGKIQASRIDNFGNYVCFVQLGADTTAAMDTGDEAVIEQCQEQNELALDVISKAVAQ